MSDYARCEQFCSAILGPEDKQPTEDFRGCCADCSRTIRRLTHEVLPAIRRHGYWAPLEADVEDELAALIRQEGLQERLLELLTQFDDGRLS